MKTTKLLFTMLLTLISIGAWAQEITIDGIRYASNGDDKTAHVAGIEEGVTTANIVPKVTLEGNEYAVTNFAYCAFANSSVTSVTLPEGFKSLADWNLFSGSNLSEISIPSTCVEINTSLGMFPSSLTNITISENNPIYYSENNCIVAREDKKLLFMPIGETFPSGITYIGPFCTYEDFQELTIPSSVTTIEGRSFMGSIGTVNIPSSVTKITGRPFESQVTHINVDNDNPAFYSKDDCLIEKYKGKLIQAGKSAIVPAEVEKIASGALHGHDKVVIWNQEYPYKPNPEYEWLCDSPYGETLILQVPQGSLPRYLYNGWFTADTGMEAITDGISTFIIRNDVDTWFAPHIDMVTTKAGDEVELSVILNADQPVTGFQFDLYLPDGIEVTTDEDDYEDIYLSTTRTNGRKHSFTSQQQPDGSWRVLCYSNNNNTLEGNEGEVCTINVKIDDNLAEGSYPIIFKNVVTSYLNGEGNIEQSLRDALKTYINLCPEPEPYFKAIGNGDATGDGVVNVTDITSIVSYILGNNPTTFKFWQADAYQDETINVTDIAVIVDIIMNGDSQQQAPRRKAPRRTEEQEGAETTTAQLEVIPFAIAPGEEKEVEVVLNNPDDAFTGFQFDLTLPEGITLVSDEDGYYVNLGSRTTSRKHTIEASLQADGTIRVMAYSNRNSNFTGSEGDVAILTLKGDDQLTAGVYDVQLKNIVLSQANGGDIDQKVPADYEASILSGTLAENPVIKGDITAEASTAISSAVSEAVTSIDLTQAVAVADDATFTTANPNALIFAPAATTNTTKNVVAGDVCANLQLSDAAVFATPKAFTATTATIARSLTAGTYATLVLPFALTAEQLSSFTNAYTYSETSTDPDAVTVYFTTTNAVTANEPFLALPTATKTSLVFEGVSVEKGNPVVKGTSLDLIGNYDGAITLGEGSFFVAQNQFYRSTGKSHLNSFRAYIAMQEAGVKALNLCIDGNETAITEAKAEVQVPADIYDLLGRKVVKAHKGVYIQNGHKFVR